MGQIWVESIVTMIAVCICQGGWEGHIDTSNPKVASFGQQGEEGEGKDEDGVAKVDNLGAACNGVFGCKMGSTHLWAK